MAAVAGGRPPRRVTRAGKADGEHAERDTVT